MKLNYFSIVLLLFVYSCTEDKSQENLPPLSPVLAFPADRQECLFSPLSMEWSNTSDPEGDPVSYKLEISESNSFDNLAFFTTTTETTATFDLEPGTTYFWRVKAIDNKSNSSTYSNIRSFFTQPQLSYNHFPFSPQLENPADGAEISGSTSVLKWNSEDPDGDTLTFDLYFGTTNPPSLYKEHLEVTSYEVPVEPGNTYYLKVVAKDGKGARAIGGVWRFSR